MRRTREQERVTFTGKVREQHPPFFEVHVNGHSVEFTDKRSEAHYAYSMGANPKQLTMLQPGFRRVLLEETK